MFDSVSRRVPLEWAESLNKKFADKYEGALPCKHLNVVIRSWSFHLCSNLFQLSLVIRSLTEVRLSAESNILASLFLKNLKRIKILDITIRPNRTTIIKKRHNKSIAKQI